MPAAKRYVSLKRRIHTTMEKEIKGPMPRIIKRIILLFIGATLIGLLICYTTGRWSVRGFTEIQFGLGGILCALSCLEGYSQETQLKWFTFSLRRSAGFAPSGERPPNSMKEMLWADSEVLPYLISGLLTIGLGLGICAIFG